MNILLEKQAKKYLFRLNDNDQNRLITAIEKLSTLDGDIKKMKGSSEYRLRVGDFRVIFEISEDNIIVTKIGPRGDVYK